MASGAPFHSTCDEERKPVPVTLRVNPEPVAIADDGLSVVSPGMGGLIGRLMEPEDTPAAATEMPALPTEAIRLAATDAVSCVALTNLVVSDVPFHWMVSPVTKFVPVTARVKAAPRAVADAGFRAEIDGTGASTSNESVTLALLLAESFTVN